MAELDPVLAGARTPRGEPRFYPHGKHPAAHRLRAHLDALQKHRERLDDVRRAYETDHVTNPYRETPDEAAHRKMVEETEKLLAHVKMELALFEEGESIAKADHVRMVEGRPR